MNEMNQSITCKHAVGLILRSEEHRLTQEQQIALKSHLKSCSLCRTFDKQNQDIVQNFPHVEDPTAVFTREEKDEIVQVAIRSAGQEPGESGEE